MTDSRVVIVDPQARAKWDRESLLVLQRPSEDGRYRSALMRPLYCCHTGCQCAEVGFEVSLIDEPFADVSHDDARIERALNYEDEPMTMALRFELQIAKFCSIRLSSESCDMIEPELDGQELLRRSPGVSDEMVAWVHALERCFVGEVLDELWCRHLLARGRDPRQLHRRPPDRYDGGTVAWSDVCPTARPDIFVHADDLMTVAHDDYCPNPTCECAEAHVSFETVEGSIGTVLVSLETDELRVIPQEGWSQEELQAAWRNYIERWPGYRDRLRERHRRLRAALHNAMQRKTTDITRGALPRRSEAKVGRNAPCPCGSGRKYKRCCGLNRGST